jgi:integrase/recombinase XerC/integrase/recombinase XerD
MKDISLKQAYELFIFDRQTFCLDKTIENYENTIRYFCSYLAHQRGATVDEIKISSITGNDLKNYIVWLRNRPLNMNHPFKEPGGKLSKRSIRNYTVDIKTFFHYLHQEGLAEDLFNNVKVIKPEKKVIVPLSAKEVEKIDSCYNTRSRIGCRNYCMIHLMLDAGLRLNEVCILRLQDMNFDNKYIQVHGKGSKERIVPMSRNLRKYLYEYVSLHRTVTSDYLFTDTAGNIISGNSVNSVFARLRKKCGVQRLRPHLLRHTFATCFIMGGGSVEMLRILMGHESINTTQLYMHLAAVYELNDAPYELDPCFFRTYMKIRK